MNHLLNITKKELRELLTPSSIISIVVVMIMMCSIGIIISGETENASKLSPVGVVDGDDGEYSDYTIEYIKQCYLNNGVSKEDIDNYVIILESEYGDSDAIVKEMAEKGLSSAIAIAPDYSENISSGVYGIIEKYYLYSNGGLFSSTSSEVNDLILSYANNDLSLLLLEQGGFSEADAKFLQNPIDYSQDFTEIDGVVYEGITPYEISTSLMSQTLMVPLIIMIIIVMIGSIVISSMGNEKENKTLETLLTLPVKRTTIVSGKLIASAIVGLIFGLAYMVGMNFYMTGVTSTVGGVNLADYGLYLDTLDWLLLGVMVFLTIMCALGMCMILGAFVKNYKAAQTMTLPISVLAMIPMFITMFIGWNSLPVVGQAVMFLIPFTHPMMAMTNLMFGDIWLVLAGIVYLLIFSLAMIYLTVRLYKSDILLTGLSQTKFMRTLNRIFAKKGKNKA
ncbi:MAG: ABC transporter permease [Candidatus Methanogranum gryphiswaldense]|nr:MAG: ABC transporter permease [Candidatus Methanogranum sp. U3.2.1]